jgi:diadenosine tetraphosphate (Ap4A) HIT family hydrolase
MTEIASLCVGASDCALGTVDPSRIVWSSSQAVAIWDAYPVSVGHALIVPGRHVASWSELTTEEKTVIIAGLDAVWPLISARHHPDGYNVGFNDGASAGQTVMHFHLHVIPRYHGDVIDPRGGIRWVLGRTAIYWQDPEK